MRSERKVALVMLAISVAAGFLANLYTKTDEELIDDYLKGAQSALESGDLERCMLLVHPRYHCEGVCAEELRSMCMRLLVRAPARDVTIVKRSAIIAGPKPTVYLSLIYLPKPKAKLAYGVKSRWRVDLLKVRKFRPVGKEPVSHLRDLRYYVVLR